MCGRYNLITDAEALVDFFEIERTLFDVSTFQPRYNIAPSQDVPIVRDSSNGRELLLARWGLVPHWSAACGDAGDILRKLMLYRGFSHKAGLSVDGDPGR